MRSKFDDELELLNKELIKMGALCEDAIAVSAKALDEGNASLASKAAELSEQIDRREREIEGMCMRLLLRQQPVAKDLRVISSALKMVTDMERIGDQAADIAQMAHFVSESGCAGKVHIEEMAVATIKMVTESIDSFVKADISLAKKVMKDDDEVDDLFLTVKNELIESVIGDKKNAEALIDLLMIAKYLERIGDHAVNIAEWVVYSLTGKK